MSTPGRSKVADLSAASRRTITRQAAHVRRLVFAARRAGPGRLAGGVARCDLDHARAVVHGWAGVPGRQLVAVLVTVDGQARTAAELGLPTPTDPQGLPFSTRSPNEGWRAVLTRKEIPSGQALLGAIGVFADGLTEQLLELPIDVPAQILAGGAVDHPVTGSAVDTSTLLARGWLLDPEDNRVEVRIGDQPPRQARLLADHRPDLAELVDDPIAPMAGWHLLVDTPVVDDPTAVDIVATAVGPTGSRELGRATITVVPPAPRPEPDAARLAVLRARADAEGASHRARTGGVHLLVVTHDLGLGGGQLYLHEILRLFLQAEDVSCTVLAPVDGPLRDELEAWGARVHKTAPLPVDGLGYEARMAELARLVAGTGANAVLVNTTGAFWGVDLAARCGLPAVWAIHESFSLSQYTEVGFPVPLDAEVTRRLRASFAQAAALVFEADATKALYAGLGPADHAIRIDYGVDLEHIERYEAATDRDLLRRAEGFGPDDIVLLCLGTYEPRKAQATLAAAFARIAERHPTSTLALVGDTGSPYAIGVRHLAARLGLGDRLRLVPVTADIDAWYRLADAFVLTSDIESLPRSILEALAYGLPVLATSVFGVPELLVDRETAVLVEPNCLGSLTAGLDRLLSMSPEDRARLAERGKSLVRPARPSKHYADAYRVLLEQLIANPDIRPGDALGHP